jgi:hypothetical protein
MFLLKSRFGDLPGEWKKLVREDLKEGKIPVKKRGAGKIKMPTNATPLWADFRLQACLCIPQTDRPLPADLQDMVSPHDPMSEIRHFARAPSKFLPNF